jgi:hypothetical protein
MSPATISPTSSLLRASGFFDSAAFENIVFDNGYCEFIDCIKPMRPGWIDPRHQGGLW